MITPRGKAEALPTPTPISPPAPRSAAWLPLVALLAVVAACALYWVQLIDAQRAQLAYAEDQTRLRASQMSNALALQVGTLVSGLEYLAHSLAIKLDANDDRSFLLALHAAQEAFPRGSLTQIAVTDADGVVRYSSLDPQPRSGQPPVSIADREHFRVHAERAQAQLFISRPVLGRVSGKWTIQFSYPVRRAQRFAGVVVLSVAPDYISGYFREVFTEGSDVAMLLREDGSYLARSHLQEAVLDKQVPSEREFLSAPLAASGEYQVQAPVDGTARYYAWHRVAPYPLIVSVGLERDRALSSTLAVIRDSRAHSALGTAAILSAALWITVLFARQRRHRAALATSEARLKLALEGGGLGSWTWDAASHGFNFDHRWCAMLGLDPATTPAHFDTIRNLIHPDDWPQVRSALDAHFEGRRDVFESEHRMHHRDGRWLWISARGRITHRAADGTPLRLAGTHLDITARRHAEDQRAELQQRLSKLVAQVPGCVYQYRLRADGSSAFPYVSAGIRDIYEIDAEAVAVDAAPVFRVIHPDDLPRVADSIAASARDLTPWDIEYRVIHHDGEVRWLSGHAKPEREADGGTLWHGYIHDITERHAVHEALHRSEERLRLTVAAVRDGLWEWDTAANVIRWDARCAEMLDFPAQPMPLDIERWRTLIHPRDRDDALRTIERHIDLGEPFSAEFRVRTAHGDWRWIELRGQVVAAQPGRPARIIGTQTDISQRIADTRLRRALLDNNAAEIILVAPDRTVRLTNQRAIDTFSPDGRPLTGRKLNLIHPDDQAFYDFQFHYATLRTTGEVRTERQLRNGRGQLRWFALHGTLLDPELPDGDAIWTLIDTTDRRRAEEALSAARMRLTEVIQHFPGGVLVEDAHGHILVANQTLCSLLGLPGPATALVGKTHAALRAAVGDGVFDTLLTDPAAADDRAHEREADLPDGRQLRSSLIPVRLDDDDIGRLWIVHDVTERRRHERALERLASTDALTGLANRRAFMAQLDAELNRVVRGGEPGVLLMLDLDHFKRVNDTYGHPAGDAVLVELARVLRTVLRRDDLPGRLGGEEFAVLLPATATADAAVLAERLRATLERDEIDSASGPIRITASIGIAPLAGADSSAVLASADTALYQAKGQGRNRVVVADAAARA